MYIVRTWVIEDNGEAEEHEYGPFVYNDVAERCVIALAGNPSIAGARIVPAPESGGKEAKRDS